MPRPKRGTSIAPAALRFCACLLVVAAIVAQAVATARAQDQPYDEAEYQRLIGQALDEFGRGNWDEAEGLFAQAHRIHPNARTLRGLGVSAFEARRYVRAIEHLQAALSSSVNPLSDEQRAEVQRALERAESYVATVEITVDPAAADVRVNGEVLEPGRVRVARVDPGLVQVQASASRFASSARELRVAAGERTRLSLQLVPERAQLTGDDAGARRPVAVDPHADRAPLGGPRFHAWKWITLSVGGVALLGGGTAHLIRELTVTDYNADDRCLVVAPGEDVPGRCRDYRDTVRDTEVAMAIGYAAGGLLVGAAVAMFVLEGGADPTPERAAGCTVDLGAMRCLVRF